MASYSAANELESQKLQHDSEEAMNQEATWATVNAVASTVGFIAGAVGVAVAIAAAATPVGWVAAGVMFVGVAASAMDMGARARVAYEKNSKLGQASESEGSQYPKGFFPAVSAAEDLPTISTVSISASEGAGGFSGTHARKWTTVCLSGTAAIAVAGLDPSGRTASADVVGYGADILSAEADAAAVVDGASDIAEGVQAVKAGGTVASVAKGAIAGGASSIVGVATNLVVDYGESKMAESQAIMEKSDIQRDELNKLETSLKNREHCAWAR